ncbi:MAG: cytochrome-c peroxidase [Pseudomonadota bacterium]
MMKLFIAALIFSTLIVLTGCGGDGVPADPEIRDYSQTFSSLPTTSIYPEDNALSVEKEQLGELLFWDPILSGDQNVACASCHHPDFGWADGRRFSVGSDGIGLGPDRFGDEVTPLHAPTILNVAFTGLSNTGPQDNFVSGGYFWDLRADTLEEQAIGPIKNPVEMLGYNVSEDAIFDEIIMRLQAIPEYVDRFEQAFETTDAITEQNIANAIATFQRKIIAPNTRFDRFLDGETDIFSEQEVIGLNKFIDGGCSRCHSGPMLSDNLLRDDDIIVGDRAVRTPTLRGLSATAPFMHDGSSSGLNDAISIYEERDDIEVTIGDGDFGDIEVFLRTLNTNNFYRAIPTSVPSGLTVGGDIN